MKIDPKFLSAEVALDSELLQKANEIIQNITQLESLLDSDISQLAIQIQQIQESIPSEVNLSDIISQLQQLESDLTAEIQNRINEDSQLNSFISSEVSDRIAEDNLIKSDLSNEVLNRTLADNELQLNINAEITNRINSDNDIVTLLNAETSNRLAADLTLQTTKVQKSGDSMTGNLHMLNNSIESVNKIDKRIAVTVPTYTTAIQGGTLELDNESTSVHFITGTVSNFSVKFPNATTLHNGVNYEIYNRTNSPITLKYQDDSLIGILSPESVSSLILQDNSTVNGMYSPFSVEVNQASGISNYNATSSSIFSTTSDIYTVIDQFSITPAAGKYAIWFSCSATSSTNNANNFVVLSKNGTIIQESERRAQSVSSNFVLQLQTLAIIDFDGTEELTASVKVTSGTLTITDRTGVAIRLGPVG